MITHKPIKKSALVLFVLAVSLAVALTVVNQARAADNFPPVPGLEFDFPPTEPAESSPDPLPSPAIWAAHLCVGEDGHDENGWLTLDAEVADGHPLTLYVAAGPDGPWYATAFAQPPYVLSYADVDALVALTGVAEPGALWFKANELGSPANLASMIEDRAAHMDELCGS